MSVIPSINVESFNVRIESLTDIFFGKKIYYKEASVILKNGSIIYGVGISKNENIALKKSKFELYERCVGIASNNYIIDKDRSDLEKILIDRFYQEPKEWSICKDEKNGNNVLLPSLYVGVNFNQKSKFKDYKIKPDATGLSIHETIEKAKEHALNECIERHSIMNSSYKDNCGFILKKTVNLDKESFYHLYISSEVVCKRYTAICVLCINGRAYVGSKASTVIEDSFDGALNESMQSYFAFKLRVNCIPSHQKYIKSPRNSRERLFNNYYHSDKTLSLFSNRIVSKFNIITYDIDIYTRLLSKVVINNETYYLIRLISPNLSPKFADEFENYFITSGEAHVFG
ncbi:YcaO-like family protein [Vibrio sp. CUB2]|uniref:YcaO-like family protein n=1 Tax=Vibrio sp. CUB2 TaxID=2315233 RepID=UPI00076A9309|nr:YcaO-like family protein [Vibrio sp. CUB2]